MLRRRTMMVSGSGTNPEPPPPKPKENYIYFEINCPDGQITLGSGNSGLTFKKLTSNIKGSETVNATANKTVTASWKSASLTPSGETIVKIKAYIDTCSSQINSIADIKFGSGYWGNSSYTIDFGNMDCSTITGINKFVKASGSSNVTGITLKNFDGPNLIDLYNKNEGWWAMGIFAQEYMLENVNFINFNTPKLQSIKGMFMGSGIQNADLSGLDTTSVTTIEKLFDNCYGVVSFRLMFPMNNLVTTTDAFTYTSSNATFYYNKNYDYSKVPIPNGWKKTPV